MPRWRKRAVVAASVILAVLVARIGWSLWPPSLPVFPEWPVLDGITVINPGRDRRENQAVIVRGGRIESIRERGLDVPQVPRGRMFKNRYALPGLIDMDVQHLPAGGHLQRLFGAYFLMAGVTTVRAVGNFDGNIRALQADVADGEFPWPRLITCGRTLEGNPPACAESRTVRDAAEALRAVDELAAIGAGCVSVGQTLSAEVLAAVHAAAAAKRLPVVGDVPAGMALADAPLDEVRLIGALSTAQPARGVSDLLRNWQAADPAALDELARTSATRGLAYTPSLVRWMLLARVGDPSVQREPFVQLLPRFYREVIWERELAALTAAGQGAGGAAAVIPALGALQQAVRRLHAAGVRLHVGTGTPAPYVVPGVSVWSEMRWLVAVGLTPEEAWVAATRAAGESLGIPQLGVLEDGAPADLLLFREDPTRNLDAMQSLEAVMTQGRLYPARRLNGYVLEYARYVQGALYDRLSMLLARLSAWWSGSALSSCDL